MFLVVSEAEARPEQMGMANLHRGGLALNRVQQQPHLEQVEEKRRIWDLKSRHGGNAFQWANNLEAPGDPLERGCLQLRL